MKRFSEIKGHRPVKDIIQIEKMDDSLRNSVWNVLDLLVWANGDFLGGKYGESGIKQFARALLADFFKEPRDTLSERNTEVFKFVRDRYFDFEWYEVYDFIEYTVEYFNSTRLSEALNEILSRELSGYRIISDRIVDITDEQEVMMLEDALSDTSFKGVTSHLQRALELLSDRSNPDYRNSIKESISAVESMCRIITGLERATLGDAIKVLESKHGLHPALKAGFSSLYGYANDKDGIRHAMIDEPNLHTEDAKFFLLSCTSFVNYLKSKL